MTLCSTTSRADVRSSTRLGLLGLDRDAAGVADAPARHQGAVADGDLGQVAASTRSPSPVDDQPVEGEAARRLKPCTRIASERLRRQSSRRRYGPGAVGGAQLERLAPVAAERDVDRLGSTPLSAISTTACSSSLLAPRSQRVAQSVRNPCVAADPVDRALRRAG